MCDTSFIFWPIKLNGWYNVCTTNILNSVWVLFSLSLPLCVCVCIMINNFYIINSLIVFCFTSREKNRFKIACMQTILNYFFLAKFLIFYFYVNFTCSKIPLCSLSLFFSLPFSNSLWVWVHFNWDSHAQNCGEKTNLSALNTEVQEKE